MLSLYDSPRSQTSSIRDTFVNNLKQQVSRNPSLASVKEVGLFDEKSDISSDMFPFEPLEHVAYASKGIPAMTVTVASLDKVAHATRNRKYNIIDQDYCLCKLNKVMSVLNEAIAQTIMHPDLQIEGEIFGTEEMSSYNRQYLLQITRFFQNNSRAPWFIERDSPVSSEIFRLFQQTLL